MLMNINDKSNNKARKSQAIILAAGFSRDFVPITYNTPLGLILVNNEVLIERLISQLHDVGVWDITVVVGHLSNKYAYLEEMFKVKIISKNDIENYSKESMLAYLNKDFKNTYLINSNVYLKESIFNKVENETWLYSKNKEPIGVAYLKGGVYKQLLKRLKSNKDIKVRWPNLLKDVSDVKLKTNSRIIEFKTLEQIMKFDRDFLSNLNNDVINTIVKVFNVGYSEIKGLKPMFEGMTNLSFLFKVKGIEYVFRVPGQGTDLLIVRAQEADVYKKIKLLNISDEVIYMDPIKGYKITKFYKGVRAINPYNDNEVILAIDKIKQLHQKNLTVDHSFNILEKIKDYSNFCKILDVKFTQEYLNLDNNLTKVKKFIKGEDRPFRLCHIDPVANNFLVFKDMQVKLIDWEYSGMSDPIMDIAMFGISQKYTSQQMDRLLEIYLERLPKIYELKLFYSYIALSSELWYLWTIIKASSGDSHINYAKLQLNYISKYSEKALELKKDVFLELGLI